MPKLFSDSLKALILLLVISIAVWTKFEFFGALLVWDSYRATETEEYTNESKCQ